MEDGLAVPFAQRASGVVSTPTLHMILQARRGREAVVHDLIQNILAGANGIGRIIMGPEAAPGKGALKLVIPASFRGNGMIAEKMSKENVIKSMCSGRRKFGNGSNVELEDVAKLRIIKWRVGAVVLGRVVGV